MTRPGPAEEIRWDEYAHFASFGWDLHRIAERLGVHPGSLRTGLQRRAEKDKNARTERVA